MVPEKNIRIVAFWQLYLALMPVADVLLDTYLVNKIGHRWTGILGFGGYIVRDFIIGGCYIRLTESSIAAFVV